MKKLGLIFILFFLQLGLGFSSNFDAKMCIAGNELGVSGGNAAQTGGKLDSLALNLAKDKPVVVVGESMGRVNNMAEQLKALGYNVKTYSPRNFRSVYPNVNKLDMEANRSWLRYWSLEKNANVIDIGLDLSPTRTFRSPFYKMESQSLYNNWNYQNVFQFDPGF